LSSHREVVKDILPCFAKNLQQEGIISGYSRKTFKVQPLENFPPFTIKPDLVLNLPDGKSFLVEVANPKDPKRLMGEITCAKILGFNKIIAGALIFILPIATGHPKAHTEKRLVLSYSISQVEPRTPVVVITWGGIKEADYHNLKQVILDIKRIFW